MGKWIAGTVVLLGLALTVEARTGSDSFGYTFKDSDETVEPPTYTWEEIQNDTVAITSPWNDNASAALDLGFAFPFYGQTYTQCYVGSNGNLQFSTPTTTGANAAIPDAAGPNNMIALYWDDLSSGSGRITYKSFGAPDAHFIVQWTGVSKAPEPGGPILQGSTLTFQVKLYPSGRVVFNYNTFVGSNVTGLTATVGIENAAGTTGLQYSYNTVSLRAGLCIEFNMNRPPDAPTNLTQASVSKGPAQPSGFLTDASIFFRANATDPDLLDTVGLEVEVLPLGTPFDPINVTGQLYAGSSVPAGQVPETAATLVSSGDFHWRARAFDAVGIRSGWSIGLDYHVDLDPPTLPAVISPIDGDVPIAAEGGFVTFSWQTSTDGESSVTYTLEVALDTSFTQIVYSESLATTSQAVSMMPGDYFWRVQALDEAGNSSGFSSSLFEAKVERAPAPPPSCGVATPPSIDAGSLLVLVGVVALMVGGRGIH